MTNSDGNNYSHGNNWSHGNNYSDGNNCSLFIFDCRGTHKSIFCKDKEGIAYQIFNQQFDKEKYDEFRQSLLVVLDGFLPRTVNFREMKKAGWHTKHDDENKYVER
jgi:hypothetical protein